MSTTNALRRALRLALRAKFAQLSLYVACALLANTPYALASVEINTANEAELDSVKGLGPSSTERIMRARTQSPFVDWQDFMQRIKGIRPKTAQKLSDNGLTVNGTTYPAPPQPASTTAAPSAPQKN